LHKVAITNETGAHFNVTGGTTTLDQDGSLTNKGTVAALTGATLELFDTTVTNTNGAINVDATSILDLDGPNGGATGKVDITNGTLDNFGTVAAESINALHKVAITNETGAHFNVTGGTTTLDQDGSLTNKGTVAALTGATLELFDTTVTNTNGAINVDATSILDLDGTNGGTTGKVDITNGTLDNFGTVAAESINALHKVAITDRKSAV